MGQICQLGAHACPAVDPCLATRVSRLSSETSPPSPGRPHPYGSSIGQREIGTTGNRMEQKDQDRGTWALLSPSWSMAKANTPPPPNAETSACVGWVSAQHYPWMPAWVGGQRSGRKTNNGWGWEEAGSRCWREALGGRVLQANVSWTPAWQGILRA